MLTLPSNMGKMDGGWVGRHGGRREERKLPNGLPVPGLNLVSVYIS